MITTINRAIAQKEREEGEKGFTLIELLVVILIIGVLAAIAIPAFLNQRQGAWESQVESDIRNAVIAAESYAVSKNGSYLGLDDAALTANGFRGTTDVVLALSAVTATGYTITGSHTLIGTPPTWTYSTTTGTIVKSP